jgi:hypothetical protein
MSWVRGARSALPILVEGAQRETSFSKAEDRATWLGGSFRLRAELEHMDTKALAVIRSRFWVLRSCEMQGAGRLGDHHV